MEEPVSRVARAVPNATAKYLCQPRATLVQDYSELLRAGKSAEAATYRTAVVAAFESRSSDEAFRLESWLENVATFLRRMGDLMTRVSSRADANTRPFARAEVVRQTEHGLSMLRAESAVPPVRATIAGVMQQAGHERNRRIAEIDTFYRGAQAGGVIMGVPCTKSYKTFWLRDGRLIFHDLNAALSMSPRPVFLQYFNYWPTSIRKHKEYQYGPRDFQGARPTSIEYVDANFVKKAWNFEESAIKELGTDSALDGVHENDRYRLEGGPWRPYPHATTPELESQKAAWYARLQAQARAATGD